MRRVLLPLLVLTVMALAPCAHAQKLDSNLEMRLTEDRAFVALRAAAQRDGIALNGIDSPSKGDALNAGDSVTALITLHEKKGRRTQWILHLEAIPGPVAPGDEDKPVVLYTSTGNRFEFSPASTKVRVRTIGPCSDDEPATRANKIKRQTAEISINRSFLSLGFDRGAALLLRQHDLALAKHDTNFEFHFNVGDRPFDRASILQQSNKTAALHITQEEEESVVGWLPATISYFSVTMDCPDLQSILWKVVKLPSVWSMMKDRGVNAGIKFDVENLTRLPLDGWHIPGVTNGYAIPWTGLLNDQPALDITMAVTSPHPPFVACAGIIGMMAENPSDHEKYLALRIIAAHSAASPAPSSLKNDPSDPR